MAYADERDAVAAKMQGKPLWYRRLMREHYGEKWDRETQERAGKEESPARVTPTEPSTKT